MEINSEGEDDYVEGFFPFKYLYIFIIVTQKSSDYIIENKYISVKIDENCRIKSLFDRTAKRELIATGTAANVFKFHEDIPLFWDAWDVEVYHLEKSWEAVNCRLLFFKLFVFYRRLELPALKNKDHYVLF
jgi:hypothetical protein